MSHSIGHSLGATYSIPHGITSCLTLSSVVAFKAETQPEESKQIARILPYIGESSTGNSAEDSKKVSVAIAKLVEGLGHKSTLTQVRFHKTVGCGFPTIFDANCITCSTMFRRERKNPLQSMP